MVTPRNKLDRWVAQAARLWLFLDYDGSLCGFPETPDKVEADAELIDLISQFSEVARLRVAVITGRRLKAIQVLLPVKGIFLAGVYGVEIQTPEGEIVQRGDYRRVRPFLEQLKPRWQRIILGHPEFYLEDKDWSLALHSKSGEQSRAKSIFSECKEAASEGMPENLFRWFEDMKYLELVPSMAHKGQTVQYLLDNIPFADARLVYVGDDCKDEEAFETIHAHGGINIQVSNPGQFSRLKGADMLMKSPEEVRKRLKTWLQFFAHE